MKKILLAFVLLSSVACQRGGVFQVQKIEFERRLGDCKPESNNCASLELIYPRLSGGAKEGREKLNAEIQAFSFRKIDDTVAKDAEATAADLLSEYEKFKKEFPQAPQTWYDNRAVKVLANTAKVFSISMEMEGYMGGAHPNTRVEYRSYDPKTARRYGLGDWLKPGYEKPLNALGEKAFRKARDLGPEEDLDDAGFTFENGFKLNDNFAATPEGLLFYFNPYEVASYADGPTELTIPYSELKDWLLPRGPLSGLLR